MKGFLDYIFQYGSLSQQHIAIIEQEAAEMVLQKGEYFSRAGKIPTRLGFIQEGVVRGCYYDENGEEITRCFIAEGSMVADYLHFEAGTPASEYLQACTDCKLLVFSKPGWDRLSEAISGWDKIRGRMVHACMHQKSKVSPVISKDATSRYLDFMESHPTLVNRVPLAYIASFLGVTQQSLSRIRRNLV